MSSATIWLVASLILLPSLVHIIFQPGPLTLLMATPILCLLWLASVPILYLVAGYILDQKWSTRSTKPRPWQDDSARLRSVPTLSFLTPAAWSAQCTRLEWARSTSGAARPPIYPPSLKVSGAIDDLLNLIMRDFVAKWHTPLATGSENPDRRASAPEFPDAVEMTIRHSLSKLVGLASDVDIATLTVRSILPRFTQHLDSYRKAEHALRGSSKSSELHALGSDQVDLFLAGKYEGGRLHEAVGDMSSLNTKHAEQAHLRKLVFRLLKNALPQAELDSAAVVVVVREILACTILYPIIDMISDPDFWNNLVDQKAGAVIHEQKLVNKLREALDRQDPAHVVEADVDSPISQDKAIFQAVSWPQTRVQKTDQRSFDVFLKNISQTTSILEARRTKNDIALQIRKTKANLERTPEKEGNPKRVQLQTYLQRLESAHSLVEKKIVELGSGRGVVAFRGKAAAGADPNASRAKLRDVLLNPSSLSFFMEFMDRRKRLILVQFWLIVESFKNPLEEVGSDSEDMEPKMRLAARSPPPPPPVVKTLREDIELFDTVYFSSPLIKVNYRYIDSARRFLREVQDNSATAVQVLEVRHSVLRTQREVYDEMEEDDWPAFKRSDLFLKAAQDLAPDPDLSAGLASSVSSLGPATGSSKAVPLAPHEETINESPKSLRSSSPVDRRMGPQHADLFGTEDGLPEPFAADDRSDRKGALFSERPAASRSKSSAMAGNLDILIGGRTQHAGPDGRAPLFRNDPLFDDIEEDGSDKTGSSTGSDYVQIDKMDEIQNALHSIIDEDLKHPSTSSSLGSLEGLLSKDSAYGSAKGKVAPSALARKLTRNPASRGQIGRIGRKLVTNDGTHAKGSQSPLFKEEGSDSEGDHDSQPSPSTDEMLEDQDDARKTQFSSIRRVAPGDLNLDGEIRKMTEKLEKLRSQEEILDALIRKAELTGARAGEVRLLQKSRSAVRREARDLKWQRDQFETQLSENTLIPGQTRVAITGTSIALDEEGKEYAVYLIEVNLTRVSAKAGQRADAAAVARGWIVGRRYSEFWTLHQNLKERFAEVRALESDFPGKRLVGLVHAPFVDARKAALERYLQALVKLPAACGSEDLRMFLSQSPSASPPTLLRRSSENGKNEQGGKLAVGFPGRGLVKSLFKGMTGVAEGLDDLIGLGPSMLDVVAQRLSNQTQGRPGTLINGIPDIDLVSKAMNQGATAAELKEAADAGTTYWTEPICDLFVELFELKEKNNWLRRQAIVILLQQLFGSTIERKVRDSVTTALSPEPVISYIGALKNGLWPNGELKPPTPPRTPVEKEMLRESANKKLSTLLPELAANFIGRENARRGTRRIFTALQNKRLNKHLVYTVLEMVIDETLTQ